MRKKETKVVNKGIDTTELLLAMEELEKTNGIKKDFLMESIESALVVAYKRNFECTNRDFFRRCKKTRCKFQSWRCFSN